LIIIVGGVKMTCDGTGKCTCSEEPSIKTPIIPGGIGWSSLDDAELQAVADLLKTPDKLFRYRGSEPTQCSMLEDELREKLGVKHALFVNSGTAALECALAAWEIGPGDEVIVPAYTYIATAAAVINIGAVPVIAEIDESLGMDPEDVLKKITPYTKAIIPVHMQGIPARLDRLRKIAKEKKLVLIEDCCQAIGSEYQGEYTGVKSHAFAWSLNFFKVLTCGEGGVFFTNDDVAFARAMYQSDPGMPMWDSTLQKGIAYPFTGGGYRGNEINAAIIRAQVKKLDQIMSHCRKLKKLLLEKLNSPIHYRLQHIDDPQGDCGISAAFIANSQELAEKFSKELLKEGLPIGSLYNSGFPDRHIYKYWDSILEKRGRTHLNYPWNDPAYKGNVQYSKDMCPNTLDILARCLRVGIHLNMTEQNILEIAEAINRVDKRL
jgi:dTDP-4-amino-4,6-dideoxygalactose transaminase